jgi:hypothetical protein
LDYELQHYEFDILKDATMNLIYLNVVIGSWGYYNLFKHYSTKGEKISLVWILCRTI